MKKKPQTSILVIGCAGFIGSHLVERLLDRGCAVTGMDRTQAKIRHLVGKPGLEFIEADIS
ncbi:MAG TPA: NAD-dependent epimerase/dehydratase family protein, partial [Planctomycetes bacterium]|nr:NAD-dependent epimerase/dehydratase family protein [Planctomycetota bacterium]